MKQTTRLFLDQLQGILRTLISCEGNYQNNYFVLFDFCNANKSLLLNLNPLPDNDKAQLLVLLLNIKKRYREKEYTNRIKCAIAEIVCQMLRSIQITDGVYENICEIDNADCLEREVKIRGNNYFIVQC